MTTRFGELPVGARFEFRGRRYEKLALSLARDEERQGNVFRDETEVVTEAPPAPGPRTAVPVTAGKEPHWTFHLRPAPRLPRNDRRA